MEEGRIKLTMKKNTTPTNPKAKVKMMPREEAEARKKAYKEKFGVEYSASKGTPKTPAPKQFASKKEMQAYFKTKQGK